MLLGSKVDEGLVSLTQACTRLAQGCQKGDVSLYPGGAGLAEIQCSFEPTITEHTMLASKAVAQTTGRPSLGRTGDQAHLNN